ncbi:MAG: hypothetical protein CYG60_12685 [Actinobacteria bacterium]|nr:MAG: hypothetical protein CYG60_12685 [Actinomycetota bacterium]
MGPPRPGEREIYYAFPCSLKRQRPQLVCSRYSARRCALRAARSQSSAEATKILPGGGRLTERGGRELEVFALVP